MVNSMQFKYCVMRVMQTFLSLIIMVIQYSTMQQ